MATITQQGETSEVGAGNHTFPFTPVSGRRLFFVWTMRSAAGNISDTLGGWTRLASSYAAGASDPLIVYWKDSDGTETHFDGGNTGQNQQGRIIEVADVGTMTDGLLWADHGDTCGVSDTYYSADATTTGPALILAFMIFEYDIGGTCPFPTLTNYSPMTLDFSDLDAFAPQRAFFSWPVLSPDTYTPQVDFNSLIHSVGITITIPTELPVCDAPVQFDVYSLGDATTPGLTYLATLCDAFDKSFRVELDGMGSGRFSINRTSADATTAILGDGNGDVRYVKVRIPDIDPNPIFGFFLDDGDFRLLDSQEEGGENLSFTGRGSLAYTDFAVMAAHSYLTTPFIGEDPFGGLWRLYAAGTGSKPGQILGRVIAETQEAGRPSQPLPLLTYGWDYTNDSDAATWASSTATDEFAAQIGESVLSVIGRLIGTGAITIQMSPDFELSGHNSFGTDRTNATYASGKVRFVGGDNIADGLTRTVRPSRVATHDIVYGESEASAVAELGDAASRVTREAYISATGTNPTTLEAIGDADLAERMLRSESLSVRIVPGNDESTGLYYPGPAGTTNGKFWVGDTITLDTGSGEFDYDNASFRVAAINVVEPDAAVYASDLEISVELGSTTPTDAASGGTATGGTLSASPGGGSSSVPPHTHPSASVDHGALSGLADDDHPQYFMDTDDILTLTTAETDASLVLAPDGAGGVEFRADSTGGIWSPTTTFDGTNWILVVDGDGNPVLVEV